MTIRPAPANDASVELKVAESIHGTYFYHLSRMPHSTIALCGARTMSTSIPVNAWGVTTSHLHERYCARCAELRDA